MVDRTEKTGRSSWLVATPFLPSEELEVLSLSLFLGCQSVCLSVYLESYKAASSTNRVELMLEKYDRIQRQGRRRYM